MGHPPGLVLLDLTGRLLVEPEAAEGGIIFFIDRPETGRGGGFIISPSFFGTVEWQPHEMLRFQGSRGYPTFTLRPCSTA